MKIVTVIGARPQFIKAATVSRAIETFNKKGSGAGRLPRKRRIQEVLVHTGQHYDYLMDRVFFEELEIPNPDHHLGVGSGSHAKQTGMMLERLEVVLEKERPDIVLVYGDTNSTLAGALAAAKLKIPVAHVEAGLRSYDRNMPEEINRLVTDHLSIFLFCPTPEAVRNLLKEGIKDGRLKVVKNVGDVMYDSIVHYSPIAEEKSTILEDLGLVSPNFKLPACPVGRRTPNYNLSSSPNSGLRTPNYYLATLHRAENTDDPKRLRSILEALNHIGRKILVVLPLHPRTRKRISDLQLLPESRGLKLIEPVSYLNMLKLERNAKAILTDSGGVQKEAYWFRIPCVTLREVTEWGYTTTGGWNIATGWRKAEIVQSLARIEERRLKKKGTLCKTGIEKAAEKIVQCLASWMN